MELHNKDTFSEDILPVVIVGKSWHYIFVVFELCVVKMCFTEFMWHETPYLPWALTVVNALSACIMHGKSPFFFLLFLSRCYLCSRVYFSKQFEILYCSQGQVFTNGQVQMESVHAELYRKLTLHRIGMHVIHMHVHVLHIQHSMHLFNILATLIMLSFTMFKCKIISD